MKKTIYLFFLSVLLSFTFLAGNIYAATVRANDATELVEKISQLSDGDTLQLTSALYKIDKTKAPYGLILATQEFSPYNDITIIGAGMDQTVIDFDFGYGLYAYYSQNVLIKDLTIKNARKNGGIHVQSGIVNLEDIRVDSCKSEIFGTKTAAYGGAVLFDANSKFSYIRGCYFSNNSAANSGGAIAYTNNSDLNREKLSIERCRFQNNDAEVNGAALFVPAFYAYLYLTTNAFYENDSTEAIYIQPRLNSSKARLYATNNTIALNGAGGFECGSSLRSYLYMNNNVMVDNATFDLKSNSNSTKYQGAFNVAETLSGVQTFTGSYNSVIDENADLFLVSGDSLKHTKVALPILAARVSASSTRDLDLYGDTIYAPGDIGAVNVPLAGNVAVWTGEEDQNFVNAANWKGGVSPMDEVGDIIISDCFDENYPIDSVDTDLTGKNIYVTPTGMMLNEEQLTVDSILVLSLSGGTGRFANNGTLTVQDYQAQKYLAKNVWTTLYITDPAFELADLVDDAVYGDDYVVNYYDEAGKAVVSLLDGSTKFDVNKGYFVKASSELIAQFPVSSIVDEDFALQYTAAGGVSAGLNLIGNPYGASIQSDKVLANAGNDAVAAGAVYVYDDSRFKVWVDGIGDEEAEEIDPAEAFFVQATSSGNFTLDKSNTTLKSTDAQREAVLKIELGTTSRYYESAYLRFDNDAGFGFDGRQDALKLNRLNGEEGSLLYLKALNGDDVNYAVCSQKLAEDTVLSAPIVVDFTPLSNYYRRFRFTLSGSGNVGYLLHDATKDSSESVVLTNNKVVNFYTGTSIEDLKNRFSLQIFDGAVPDSVISTDSVWNSPGFDYSPVEDNDTIITVDENVFVEFRDTTYKGDTIFAYAAMGDSIITTTTIAFSPFVDSIHFDSTFTAYERLLGTYQFPGIDTVVVIDTIRIRKQSGVVSDVDVDIQVKKYTVIDTLFLSGIAPLPEDKPIKVYSSAGVVYVESKEALSTALYIYDLSGRMIRNTTLPTGNGNIEIPKHGMFIVKTEQNGKVYTAKVMLE